MSSSSLDSQAGEHAVRGALQRAFRMLRDEHMPPDVRDFLVNPVPFEDARILCDKDALRFATRMELKRFRDVHGIELDAFMGLLFVPCMCAPPYSRGVVLSRARQNRGRRQAFNAEQTGRYLRDDRTGEMLLISTRADRSRHLTNLLYAGPGLDGNVVVHVVCDTARFRAGMAVESVLFTETLQAQITSGLPLCVLPEHERDFRGALTNLAWIAGPATGQLKTVFVRAGMPGRSPMYKVSQVPYSSVCEVSFGVSGFEGLLRDVFQSKLGDLAPHPSFGQAAVRAIEAPASSDFASQRRGGQACTGVTQGSVGGPHVGAWPTNPGQTDRAPCAPAAVGALGRGRRETCPPSLRDPIPVPGAGLEHRPQVLVKPNVPAPNSVVSGRHPAAPKAPVRVKITSNPTRASGRPPRQPALSSPGSSGHIVPCATEHLRALGSPDNVVSAAVPEEVLMPTPSAANVHFRHPVGHVYVRNPEGVVLQARPRGLGGQSPGFKHLAPTGIGSIPFANKGTFAGEAAILPDCEGVGGILGANVEPTGTLSEVHGHSWVANSHAANMGLRVPSGEGFKSRRIAPAYSTNIQARATLILPNAATPTVNTPEPTAVDRRKLSNRISAAKHNEDRKRKQTRLRNDLEQAVEKMKRLQWRQQELRDENAKLKALWGLP